MKRLLWMAGISGLLIHFCSFAQTANAPKTYICRQPYALCTTAPCTPVPGSKNQSICSCVVKDGPALGQIPCEARKPTTNTEGQHLLTSNFSFENAATNKIMTCTGNYPWTDCLDKPCIINPQNSNQAICMCDIKYSQSFVTFGGECNTASCSTTLYSGASMEMITQGTQAMMSYLHLQQSPMQNCPVK